MILNPNRAKAYIFVRIVEIFLFICVCMVITQNLDHKIFGNLATHEQIYKDDIIELKKKLGKRLGKRRN